jgi:hypothetical protein
MRPAGEGRVAGLGEERGGGGGQGVELGGEGLGVARVSWLARPLYTADCELISEKSRDCKTSNPNLQQRWTVGDKGRAP